MIFQAFLLFLSRPTFLLYPEESQMLHASSQVFLLFFQSHLHLMVHHDCLRSPLYLVIQNQFEFYSKLVWDYLYSLLPRLSRMKSRQHHAHQLYLLPANHKT